MQSFIFKNTFTISFLCMSILLLGNLHSLREHNLCATIFETFSCHQILVSIFRFIWYCLFSLSLLLLKTYLLTEMLEPIFVKHALCMHKRWSFAKRFNVFAAHIIMDNVNLVFSQFEFSYLIIETKLSCMYLALNMEVKNFHTQN